MALPCLKCSVCGVYVLVAQLCLTVTPWTVARQAPMSMRFSRQEYRSGLHFLLQGDLPNPGIEPRSPALQADSLPSAQPGKPIESIQYSFINVHVVWASLTSCLFFFFFALHPLISNWSLTYNGQEDALNVQPHRVMKPQYLIAFNKMFNVENNFKMWKSFTFFLISSY